MANPRYIHQIGDTLKIGMYDNTFRSGVPLSGDSWRVRGGADIKFVTRVGNLMRATMTDNSVQIAYPTQIGLWRMGAEPVPPITIYNPWEAIPISNSWFGHASYSDGGVDWGLSYGTALPAPANGTLRTSGGSGEFAAGWQGSAGRRSILELDNVYPRLQPLENPPPEGAGDMVAIVFQHLSDFGSAGHYNMGEVCCWSGASANGSDFGGDIHLHVHGLNASGQRVNFLNFIP